MRTIVIDEKGHAVINKAIGQAFSFENVEQAELVIGICWPLMGYKALEIDA